MANWWEDDQTTTNKPQNKVTTGTQTQKSSGLWWQGNSAPQTPAKVSGSSLNVNTSTSLQPHGATGSWTPTNPGNKFARNPQEVMNNAGGYRDLGLEIKNMNRTPNWWDPIGSAVGKGSEIFEQGLLNLSRIGEKYSPFVQTLKKVSPWYKNIESKANELVNNELESSERRGDQYDYHMSHGNNAQNIAYNVGQQVVPIIATEGLGGAAEGAGATRAVANTIKNLAFSAQAGAQGARQAEREGANDAQQLGYGSATGALTYAVNPMFGKIAEVFGPKVVQNPLVQRYLGKFLQENGPKGAKWLIETGAQMLYGGASGTAMGVGNNAAKKIIYDKKMPWSGDGGVVDPKQMGSDAATMGGTMLLLRLLGLPVEATGKRVFKGNTPEGIEVSHPDGSMEHITPQELGVESDPMKPAFVDNDQVQNVVSQGLQTATKRNDQERSINPGEDVTWHSNIANQDFNGRYLGQDENGNHVVEFQNNDGPVRRVVDSESIRPIENQQEEGGMNRGQVQETGKEEIVNNLDNSPTPKGLSFDEHLNGRVNEMTPDELRQAVFNDHLTGIYNRAAYDELVNSGMTKPYQVMFDMNGFKFINDNISHSAGDDVLQIIGDIMRESGAGKAFRYGGDEFIMEADTPEEGHALSQKLQNVLDNGTIEVHYKDGDIYELKGVTFGYGVGRNLQEADAALDEHKQQQVAAGIRPKERGGKPSGLSYGPKEQGQGGSLDQVYTGTQELKPTQQKGPVFSSPGSDAMAAVPSKSFNPPASPNQPIEHPPATIQRQPIAQSEPVKAVVHTAERTAQLVDDVKRWFAPASRAPEAANIIRENNASYNRQVSIDTKRLKSSFDALNKLSIPERFKIVDDIENGRPVGWKYKPIEQTFRQMLNEATEEVQSLGTGALQHCIADYFPHLWKDPDMAGREIMKIMSRRPLEGSKSFLKKRSIMTIRDGIESGLEPVSDNPAEMVMLKLREMKKYVTGQRIIQELKDKGLIKYVQAHERTPEGYTAINDKFATVYGPPTEKVSEAYDEGMMNKLKSFAESLGVPVERKLNLKGKNNWGLAYGDKSIETKFGGPESVLTHEIGHILDHRYGLSELLHSYSEKQFPIDQELRNLADLRYEGKENEVSPGFKSYVRDSSEKIANLVHAYVHAPELAKQVAPHSVDVLDQVIREHPELEPLNEIKPSLVLGSNEAEMRIQGMRIMGRYVAPEPVATLLNNHLSPGLQGKPLFDAIRGMGNMLNQVQLGMSAFHLGFTSVDSATSKVALGVKMLADGKPIKGMKNVLKGLAFPYAPIENYIRGSKGLKEYFSPGSQGAEIAKIMDGLVSAGGRVQQDPFYQNNAVKGFFDALRGVKYDPVKGQIVNVPWNTGKAILKAPGALIEALSSPIMENIVPRMKVGIFMDMARYEFERLGPDASHEEIRSALGKAWDSVDNRMGQMVYDNLFWKRTLKDAGMASVRSLGWNLGTFRELLGGMSDTVENTARAATGRLNGRPFMTHRMAYCIALPFITAIYGAMYQYLKTGQGPQELKDYYFPKTGEKRTDGSPERISLPSYMKDVYAYGKHPLTTLSHKLHPIFGMIADMMANKDFYGTQIRNPEDPAGKQLVEELNYALKQFEPFSIRNVEQAQQEGSTFGEQAQNFVGLTPAPASVGRTRAQELMADYLEQRMPQGARTPEQAKQSRFLHDMTEQIRKEHKIPPELRQAFKAHQITSKQYMNALSNGKLDPREAQFKHLPLDAAIDVYNAGNDEEKHLWRMLLVTKISKRMASGDSPPEELKNLRALRRNLIGSRVQAAR